MDVRKDLMGELLEKIAKHDLVLRHHLGSFVGNVFVRRNGDFFRRGSGRAGEVAKKTSSTDGGQNLGAPAREVGSRELVRRRSPEGDGRAVRRGRHVVDEATAATVEAI
jgi:hypothetical protein